MRTVAAVPDAGDVRGPDEGDLARTIAVAGLQVSRAGDELHEAAERLLAAERRAREAERRTAVLEEQIALGAVGSVDLLSMLEHLRAAKTAAEDRAREAEERLRVVTGRTRMMQEQIHELQGRVLEAERRPEVTLIVDDDLTALQEAVAAEVRRPLSSILGLTLALNHTDPSKGEGEELVRQLTSNVRRLDRLVGQLLSVERIAAGTFAPSPRRADVSSLVRHVVEDSPDLTNREVAIDAEPMVLSIDPALVEQMVETLCANAGRRTAPGGPVWVRVEAAAGDVEISVEDTGPELGPGREPTTGLTLLDRLAEVHGGRAWVEDRPGGGASFHVRLRASQGREPTGRAEGIRPGPSTAPSR